MTKLFKAGNPKGFTLVEIIVVLIILGILAAVVINRAMSTTSTNRIAQESVIKNHIRYAQALAVKHKTNLCIFITPHIVRNQAEAAALYKKKLDSVSNIEEGVIKINEKTSSPKPAGKN